MLYNDKLTIVANWKMNPTDYASAIELCNLYLKNLDFTKINLIIAPPTIYLFSLVNLLKQQDLNSNQTQTKQNSGSIFLSIQNFCAESNGAFTGDTSVKMVKDLRVNFAILGHSECRKYYQETDQLIAKKVILALQEAMIPIICIGETQEQFFQGDQAVKEFLQQQLLSIIKQINSLPENVKVNHVFIAYEPVWAIGSGVDVDLNYIQQNISYITNIINTLLINKINQNLKFYLLYGGSVNQNNAKEILQLTDLGGILVGGSSLKFQQFNQICKSVDYVCL